jgi:hypothetical protein
MTTTPNFDDLTPPDELVHHWCECERPSIGAHKIIACAARWGARHGWEQARQLWPEPISRPCTREDGDDQKNVYVLTDGYWHLWQWSAVGLRDHSWAHTPRWQPRQPSLQEQAREQLKRHDMYGEPLDTNLILSALEQAGEGK